MKKNKDLIVSVVGLGYVGMPIAVAFSNHLEVVGFDIDKSKIEQYLSGIDPTREIGDEAIKKCSVKFTSNLSDLQMANFHIVAVPTPLKSNNLPDLNPLIGASKTISNVLKKGDYVVYESTVFPGVTEDVCIPILEEGSGLVCGKDFKVGYSPERINPGDKVHTLENIVKVVSGSDSEALDLISSVYSLVVKAGVHKASSIKVAEASKVIENSQRDLNIAFMNELSKIFNLLNIDTFEVLEAAKTKWNFLPFTPGLVGGHCIGIDPYYLTYKAEEVGYNAKLILSGREINDGMGKYVSNELIKIMVREKIDFSNATVGILGLTFKENTPDVRNTRVIDIISELKDFGVNVLVNDPYADSSEVMDEYGIKLEPLEKFEYLDALIIAVPHDKYDLLNQDFFIKSTNSSQIFFDLRGRYNELKESPNYWSF